MNGNTDPRISLSVYDMLTEIKGEMREGFRKMDGHFDRLNERVRKVENEQSLQRGKAIVTGALGGIGGSGLAGLFLWLLYRTIG